MQFSHRLRSHRRRLSIRGQNIKQTLTTNLLKIAIVLFILGFIFSFLIFAWYAKDLPSPGKLSQNSIASTVFYDRDGKNLYEMYKDKNRIPVPISDIPNNLKKATIAIEDKNFYKHKGISETGIIRSMLNIIFRGNIQGGSTITQQLIKNTLLDSSRTLTRKIKEWMLAYSVEKKYNKDQILEMYLNEAPYGGTFYGIGAASIGYFSKQPKDLNLTESAIMAGLPQNPSYYSPFIGKKDAWINRTKDVLRRMREDGYIDSDREKKAVNDLSKVKFTSSKMAINAPHFVFYIKDQLEKEYGAGILDKGVKIKTTISQEIQITVEKIVKEEIEKLKDYKVGNGAVIVLDSQTGDLLAMVGSYDYNNEDYGKFNATLGLRQPGSAVKPITYALAFEKGYTPATVLTDLQTVFPNQGEKEYIPINYDGKFKGPVQLRFALGNSINIPAVKLLAMVGVRDFLRLASDMGLDTFVPTDENLKRFGLAVTLGGGETTLLDLTSAYTIFANGGIKRDVFMIQEIKDFNDKSIYKQIRSSEKRVLSKEVAFLVSHILSDNNARVDTFGSNSYLNIPGRTVAAKTGTTNDKRDNWMFAFTNSITVGIWVGNNDNSPMDPKIASGVTGASPIGYRIMKEILSIKSANKIKYIDGIVDKPDKVKAIQIDSFLGGLPKDQGTTRSEYFIEGTEPKDTSPFYKRLKISKTNGKLANDIEIKTGNYEEKDFIIITENDPISTDGKNRWQEAIDAWVKAQSDSKYHYPSETSDNSVDNVIVSIKSPSNQETINSNNIEIKAKLISVNPIKNVKIYLNGSEIKNIDGDNKDINEPITLNDGVYELKVVAKNNKDKQGDSTVKFGVNKPWDLSPSPIPTLTPTSSP